MLISHMANKFKKSMSLAEKRGLDISLLKEIMAELIYQRTLPAKYRDHALTGQYLGFRECHIKPDWLLIYKVDKPDIYFANTGSHSDLF